MKVSLLTTLLLVYLLLLLTVFLLQRKMMYLPDRFSEADQNAIMTELQLQAWPSANQFRGVTSQVPSAPVKGTMLVFHGNAGAALQRTYYLDALQRLGYRVIIAEYPGYGARSGSPSEAALIKDGIETAKRVVKEFDGPLYLCGESLGSGVVAGVVGSGEVPVQGLLLITPFDVMAEVAQYHYWFFLARWLVLDKFDNVAKLRGFKGPVAVIMAERDEVIPNPRTLALYQSLPAQKRLWRFEDAGHNSVPLEARRPWWREAMQFIDAETG